MTKKSLWLPVAALAIFAPGFLYAQTTDAPPPAQDFGIKFSGFVKIDAFHDDHTVVGARQDMFLLYPGTRSQVATAPAVITDPGAQALYIYGNKTDLNAHGQTVFTGVQTRLTGKITGPDAFGAKVTGLIEGDFFGYPADANIANFGLRHAWINLDWGSTNFRIGQDWHPLFTAGGVNPNTIQFNPLAPIHPFGRAPQVALTQKMGDVKLSVYAIEQSYHTDLDTTGAISSRPLSNNQIPEVAAQLVFDANGITIGGTADYKSIVPMDPTNPTYSGGLAPSAVGNNTNPVKSTTYQAFLKIKAGEATFKASTTVGSDLTSTTGRWGYAVKRDYALESIQAAGGTAATQTAAQALTKREYLPILSRGMWAEFDYGKDVEFGIVGGMVRNLGATGAINTSAMVTTAGADALRQVSTVATHVKFTSGKTWIGLEYIYSAAQYMEDDKGYKAALSAALTANGLGSTYNKIAVNGNTLDNPAVRDDRGRINNWYTVVDHRIQLSVNQSF